MTVTQLRAELGKTIPDYMIPAYFIHMDALPRTPSDKIDRRALPPPEVARPELDVEFERPRDAIEEKLLAIWRDVLGMDVDVDGDEIGIHDSFFDLGGTSLQAADLIARVCKAFDVELALVLMLKHDTIAKLAYAVQHPDEVDWTVETHMIDLRPEGSHIPLVIASGARGEVLNLRLLTDLLPQQQPIYGLRHYRSEGDRNIFETTSIEEAAAHYVTLVSDALPEGPLVLGGYSLGGLVAISIADHLQQMGREVPLVVLLDTYIGNVYMERFKRHALAFAPRRQVYSLLFTMFPRRKLVIRRGLRRLIGMVKRALGKQQAPIIPPQDKWLHYEDTRHFLQPIHQFRPRPYAGDLVYFRCKLGQDETPLPDHILEKQIRPWHDIAQGNLHIVDIDSNHSKVMDDPTSIAQVVDALTPLLEKINQG